MTKSENNKTKPLGRWRKSTIEKWKTLLQSLLDFKKESILSSNFYINKLDNVGKMEKRFLKTAFVKPDPRRNNDFCIAEFEFVNEKNSPQKNQVQMIPLGNSFKY